MQRPRIERETLRDTSSNRMALLLLLIETWQLCALSFGEGLPYDSAGVVQRLSTRTDLSTRMPWSVNGAMLMALLDLRLLLYHATDQLVGLLLLVVTPLLWLASRYMARFQTSEKLHTSARGGAGGIEGVDMSWERAKSVTAHALATKVGPFIVSALYLPLLARVAQSVACSFVTARASLVMDSSLHLIASTAAESADGDAAPTSCAELATLALASGAAPPPRFLHARLLTDLSEGPLLSHTEPVCLCGALPCWEWRMGGGGVLPHAAYALVGLWAFALVFPSASLMQLADQAPDPALDVHYAPVFRVESQLIKAVMVLGREVYRRALWPAPLLNVIGCAALYLRHTQLDPVGVEWVGRMQRCGYLVAMWAALNSLIAFAVFSPSHTDTDVGAREATRLRPAVLLLVAGWGVIVLAFVTLPALCCLERKRSRLSLYRVRRAAEEVEESGGAVGSVIRGVSGVVKRWWQVS